MPAGGERVRRGGPLRGPEGPAEAAADAGRREADAAAVGPGQPGRRWRPITRRQRGARGRGRRWRWRHRGRGGRRGQRHLPYRPNQKWVRIGIENLWLQPEHIHLFAFII